MAVYTEVGHAERLSTAEQDLAAVDRTARAVLRTRGDARGVGYVTELVQVDAVDLDGVTTEQLVVGA